MAGVSRGRVRTLEGPWVHQVVAAAHAHTLERNSHLCHPVRLPSNTLAATPAHRHSFRTLEWGLQRRLGRQSDGYRAALAGLLVVRIVPVVPPSQLQPSCHTPLLTGPAERLNPLCTDVATLLPGSHLHDCGRHAVERLCDVRNTPLDPAPLHSSRFLTTVHVRVGPCRYVALRATLLGLRMGDEAGSVVFCTKPLGFAFGSTALMCISASAILSGWILEARGRCTGTSGYRLLLPAKRRSADALPVKALFCCANSSGDFTPPLSRFSARPALVAPDVLYKIPQYSRGQGRGCDCCAS